MVARGTGTVAPGHRGQAPPTAASEGKRGVVDGGACPPPSPLQTGVPVPLRPPCRRGCLSPSVQGLWYGSAKRVTRQGRETDVLNWIFLMLVAGAVVTGAWTGTIQAVTQALNDSAKSAVDLALGLLGQMALWLGVMHVLREAGLMATVARLLKPVMVRLFPDVPPDHPAMSAMILNLVSNMLGLGNAATPFGLKAMVELNRLNAHKGVATNAMALFLAMNTSGVAVLPLGVISARGGLGSQDVGGIVVPSVLATMCSTLVAIFVAKFLERRRFFRVERSLGAVQGEDPHGDKTPEAIDRLDDAEALARVDKPWDRTRSAIALGLTLLVGAALVRTLGAHLSEGLGGLEVVKALSSDWTLSLVIFVIVLLGFSRRVPVYEAVVQGAKEGFNMVVMIIPYLVAILVAVGMFRASGALDALIGAVGPWTRWVGFPAEALPMALLRPLSGTGAFGIMTEIMKTHGPDSFLGYLVSVMNGSTETTFYVLALYFGAVRVAASRHTVVACLSADVTGVVAAVLLARVFF